MLTDSMLQKLHAGFGKNCRYRIVEENENCVTVWVHTKNTHSLARLTRLNDKVEISIDAWYEH